MEPLTKKEIIKLIKRVKNKLKKEEFNKQKIIQSYKSRIGKPPTTYMINKLMKKLTHAVPIEPNGVSYTGVIKKNNYVHWATNTHSIDGIQFTAYYDEAIGTYIFND